MKAEKLKTFDVVLCSYGTLEAAFRKQQKGFKRGNVIVKEKSPMHTFQWHRVILDEAHNIKERSTNAAKATFALDAKYRWCLSGTPLQNRVGELYSLIRFLGGDREQISQPSYGAFQLMTLLASSICILLLQGLPV